MPSPRQAGLNPVKAYGSKQPRASSPKRKIMNNQDTFHVYGTSVFLRYPVFADPSARVGIDKAALNTHGVEGLAMLSSTHLDLLMVPNIVLVGGANDNRVFKLTKPKKVAFFRKMIETANKYNMKYIDDVTQVLTYTLPVPGTTYSVDVRANFYFVFQMYKKDTLEDALKGLTTDELRQLAGWNDVDTSGTKAILVDRMQAHILSL